MSEGFEVQRLRLIKGSEVAEYTIELKIISEELKRLVGID